MFKTISVYFRELKSNDKTTKFISEQKTCTFFSGEVNEHNYFLKKIYTFIFLSKIYVSGF